MVFCKKCNHRIFSRFCDVYATHYVDPITGEEENQVGASDYCRKKNKNLDCPNFKQRVPWWKVIFDG